MCGGRRHFPRIPTRTTFRWSRTATYGVVAAFFVEVVVEVVPLLPLFLMFLDPQKLLYSFRS